MDQAIKDIFQRESREYLFPKYLDENTRIKIQSIWDGYQFSNHFFLLSSGTSSKQEEYKSYVISKEAILANAKAVNKFLKANNSDRWLSSLPFYHIGGLGIYARAYLSGSEVINYSHKWNPEHFCATLENESIQFCSIVPTQLYDLISNKLIAPTNLKAIFVGGDHLPGKLKEEALAFGYPIVETYGMTETSSQFASSFASDCTEGFLEVLPLHRLTHFEDKVKVESEALAEIEIIINDNLEVKESQISPSFLLKDKIEIKSIDDKIFIKPLGRSDSEIKIKGRLYSFLALQDKVHSYLVKNQLFSKAALSYRSHPRNGKELILLVEGERNDLSHDHIKCLEKLLPPPLTPIIVIYLDKIPRTKLGKVKLGHVFLDT